MKLLLAICLVLQFCAGAALAESPLAGEIKNLEGEVQIVRDGATIPARIGQALHVADVVVTGPGSTAGIMLEDDTVLSLGPDSRLELKDFAFDPSNKIFDMALRIMKGSFAYMSGVIGKVAPEKVRVETPDAVISTYGTRFLVSVDGRK